MSVFIWYFGIFFVSLHIVIVTINNDMDKKILEITASVERMSSVLDAYVGEGLWPLLGRVSLGSDGLEPDEYQKLFMLRENLQALMNICDISVSNIDEVLERDELLDEE